MDVYKERMIQLEDGDDAAQLRKDIHYQRFGIKPDEFFEHIDKEEETIIKMRKFSVEDKKRLSQRNNVIPRPSRKSILLAGFGLEALRL